MAASDVPMAAPGLTNPCEWDPSTWAADLLPHLAYAAAATAAYRLFNR